MKNNLEELESDLNKAVENRNIYYQSLTEYVQINRDLLPKELIEIHQKYTDWLQRSDLLISLLAYSSALKRDREILKMIEKQNLDRQKEIIEVEGQIELLQKEIIQEQNEESKQFYRKRIENYLGWKEKKQQRFFELTTTKEEITLRIQNTILEIKSLSARRSSIN